MRLLWVIDVDGVNSFFALLSGPEWYNQTKAVKLLFHSWAEMTKNDHYYYLLLVIVVVSKEVYGR